MVTRAATVVEGDGPALLCLHGGPGLSDYLTSSSATRPSAGAGSATPSAGCRRRRPTVRSRWPSTSPTRSRCSTTSASTTSSCSATAGAASWRGARDGAPGPGPRAAAGRPARDRGRRRLRALRGADGGADAGGRPASAPRSSTSGRWRARAPRRTPLESLRLVWPAYFNDPATAPPMPDDSGSPCPCYSQTLEDALALLATGEPARPGGGVRRTGGGPLRPRQPVPGRGGHRDRAAFPQGSATGVPEAGHFPWLEQPGCVADALVRLGRASD